VHTVLHNDDCSANAPAEGGVIAASTFPEGFLWGTKTSAYQIEGSVDADGRGASIWDTYSHTSGNTRNGDTGDVACDSYRLVEQDLDLLANLGAHAYAFSVAWPRVQPTGSGPANQRGLDFYRRMVDGLVKRSIVPVVTLYHWDLPQTLEDAGGWVSRDTVARFVEYTWLVAEALGDAVPIWITLNEPWCSSWLGYGTGEHAPGIRDPGKAAAANHHLLLAHGEAVSVLRARVPSAQIGIGLNLQPVRAATEHDDDRAACRRVDGNQNRLFLDPLFKGTYPADMLEHYAGFSPGFDVVADGDLEVISRPIDFLGVNFYFPTTVCAPTRRAEARAAGYCVPEPDIHERVGDLDAVQVHYPDVRLTQMGWEIEPAALTEILSRVRSEYTSIPLYVTENGAAFDDYVGPDGEIHDADRIRYLDEHLRAVRAAMDSGVDVRGYFVWSILDNFEWGQGFAKRFGLTWVDYRRQERIPKDSFAWYQRTVRDNGLAD
jgi:beta-glucosidase